MANSARINLSNCLSAQYMSALLRIHILSNNCTELSGYSCLDSHHPEMHQLKKGRTSHFGMKTHIGVDVTSGLVHTLIGTAGNVSDVTKAHALLHGDEIAALGDAGYQGVEKRPENEGKTVRWYTAMRRSERKALPDNRSAASAKDLKSSRPASAPKSSIRSMSSRTCFVIARPAIVV